ncbi:hypothetical protein DR864_09305 [Runella rosea]|uniref:Uncharacterized protein n=1 Tax=Runella rosea TaxID=2259595 RepID=A0A344TGZ4_9BACT|nr:hypothetical protein [Runella rosea]AXE17915.1 hypothetical protein DR864_09305 [Runella rosea]
MKKHKAVSIVLILAVMFAIGQFPFHNEAKAGDFVGKKVFLKQDCKTNPDFICHLRGDNVPSYKQ